MPGMAPAPTPAGMPVPIGARAAARVLAKATASRAAECEPAQEAGPQVQAQTLPSKHTFRPAFAFSRRAL